MVTRGKMCQKDVYVDRLSGSSQRIVYAEVYAETNIAKLKWLP